MANTIKNLTRLSIVLCLIFSANADAQDTLKRTTKIGYNVGLFLSVKQENYDNLRSIPTYNNYPSNTTFIFGCSFSIGNQKGLFVSGSLEFNIDKKTTSGYGNNPEMTVSDAGVFYGAVIYYRVNPNNKKYSIAPFLGAKFGENYFGLTEGNKYSSDWDYAITQAWLIHAGIMVATVHPKHTTYFAKIGYDLPTKINKWYSGIWTSVTALAEVSMGGPFISIGISAWNN